jgi:hypothetical protein
MFYMQVPDPTGEVNNNVFTLASVRGNTVSTLAHEFQHLINAARRIYIEMALDFEEVWLNEGLSHIAEELVFYEASAGLTPGMNITLAMLTTGPDAVQRVASFNTYVNQNYGRLSSFLARPDSAGAFENVDDLAVRGATWAFLRYAADRHAGDDATFWFDLVNTSLTGTANLDDVLAEESDDWLRDWITAMYADDAVTGAGANYENPSWNYRSVYGGLGGFPLVPLVLTDGVDETLNYAAGGGTLYGRLGVPMGGFAGITALSAGVPPVTPYAVSIIRTK